jgi:hypothetical protein
MTIQFWGAIYRIIQSGQSADHPRITGLQSDGWAAQKASSGIREFPPHPANPRMHPTRSEPRQYPTSTDIDTRSPTSVPRIYVSRPATEVAGIPLFITKQLLELTALQQLLQLRAFKAIFRGRVKFP